MSKIAEELFKIYVAWGLSIIVALGIGIAIGAWLF